MTASSPPTRTSRVPSLSPTEPQMVSSAPTSPSSFAHNTDSDNLTGNNDNMDTLSSISKHQDQRDSDFDSGSGKDEELHVQVPRGRMAARLLGHHAETNITAAKKDDSISAYERIRKQLMSGAGKQKSQENMNAVPSDTKESSEEEEDEGPIQTSKFRRLAQKGARKTTPRRSISPRLSLHPSPSGLFVSPRSPSMPIQSPMSANAAGSDSDLPDMDTHNRSFHERVARIRAERKVKEEEHNRNQAAEAKLRRFEKVFERSRTKGHRDSDSDDNSDSGRRLTQQARPTRKASKKALEELSRENQRINRNMQLAHQAKTKKKYSTKDLFAKLNYIPEGGEDHISATTIDNVTGSSAPTTSDAENGDQETPPTSPPSHDEHSEQNKVTIDLESVPSATLKTVDHPSLGQDLLQPVSKADKGKGRAPEFQHVPVNPLVTQNEPVPVRRVMLSNLSPNKMIDLDSDDDFEVTKPTSRFPVFDRLPKKKEQNSRSLHNLRHLAHLTSPGKQGPKGRPSMNPMELQNSLQRRARLQAQKEREEKIQELRARGIYVQTEEEREKMQVEIDNLLEKARNEAFEIAKREKAAAKKDGQGNADGLSSDESEDGDYQASGEEEEEIIEEAELELSGSEDEKIIDEEVGSDDDLEDEEAEAESKGFFDQEAGEDNDEEDEELEDVQVQPERTDEDMDEETEKPVRKRSTHRSRNIVVDEDEESDEESRKSATQQQPLPCQDDTMAAFGFDNVTSNSLGLTQMFAGTMANLQSQTQEAPRIDVVEEENSLDFLRTLPDTQPSLDVAMFGAPSQLQVPNSQVNASQQKEDTRNLGVGAGVSQSNSQSQGPFQPTQLSEVPEPTQDAGFELSRSPAGFVPPTSTIDTVIMPVAESPITKRKGRLHRRKEVVAVMSDVDEDEVVLEPTTGDDAVANAFATMLKAAAKPQPVIDDFNKKTSRAKEMVEEQAEESEDEYAGLGGQSDDDSGGEDEEIAKMIDESDVKVDERKMAAYYADKERVEDEKRINQLYKDIHNGGLRRKRGDDFELSDSEDEAAQIRRKKQLEFQKMRKALLTDEKLGKIAQNPKQAAFFRSLEDHDDDPDFELLDGLDMDMEEPEPEPSASSEEVSVSVPDSQQPETAPTTTTMTAPANPLKRKNDSQEKENRPPPHLRRTAANDVIRKPVTIADIRESVSFLIDEPNAIPDSQYSESESEDESTAQLKEPRKPIIDRLTLSRDASLAETSNASSNLAFQAPEKGHQPGFRVPSLVRRATSNLSNAATSTTSSGASTPSTEYGGVRRGGTGRSNIHAMAREAERRAAVEKAESRRKESLKKKVGRARGQRSVLGLLDGGFE